MKLFSTLGRLAVPLLSSLALVLALGGCSKPADKIVGEWVFDKASLQTDPEIQKMGEAEKALTLKMAEKMLGSMTFTFTKDGKIRSKMGASGQQGTYTVKGVEGDIVTLETKIKEGKNERSEDLKIELSGDDAMTLTGPDGKSIRFRRK